MYENELYHHGIFGQKWGKKNGPPYPLKPSKHSASEKKAGWRKSLDSNKKSPDKKTVNKIQERFKDSSPWDDISEEVFDDVKADKAALSKAKAEIDKAYSDWDKSASEQEKYFDKFNDNDDRYYSATSEIANDMLYFDGDSKYDPSKITLKEIGDATYMGVFSDGQQGPINANSMYAYKKGFADKMNPLSQRWRLTHNDVIKGAKNYVDEAMKNVGAENIKAFKNSDSNISEDLVRRMMNSYEDSHEEMVYGGNRWRIEDAAHAKEFTNRHKYLIDKAESWTKKLDNNANTWYNLREAAENLGLDDIPADKLTKNDWDRLNAELRRMRKLDRK